MDGQSADTVAPSLSSHALPLQIEALDPRADNRRRAIEIARDRVVIRRTVAGVAMAVRVASAAYLGVSLRVSGLQDGRFRYEARLLHRDPDLSVLLAEGNDQETIAAEWREWVRVLRLPALVGRSEIGDVEVNLEVTDLARRRPAPRRRGKAVAARRARFLLRRKVGRSSFRPAIEGDRPILFPGSKLDR
jgi:hypothetical protein